jgi:hypothetical protein
LTKSGSLDNSKKGELFGLLKRAKDHMEKSGDDFSQLAKKTQEN